MEGFNNLPKEEIIRQIEHVYHASYDPDSNLTALDQLEICESLEETSQRERMQGVKENVVVNGNGNDTYKHIVNFELNEAQLKVINELRKCTYRTLPIFIAGLLNKLFPDPDTKPNHWLRVAQMYPPRRINLTINQMIKRQNGGWTTIERPAAYLTYLIKFRKKRNLTGINDTP